MPRPTTITSMDRKTSGTEIERLIALLARLPGLGHRSARKAALALVTIVGGTAIGLAVGLVRFLKVPVLGAAVAVYVEAVRGTPLLVMLFVNRDYALVLLNHEPLLLGTGCAMLAGIFWIRKIVNIDV